MARESEHRFWLWICIGFTMLIHISLIIYVKYFLFWDGFLLYLLPWTLDYQKVSQKPNEWPSAILINMNGMKDYLKVISWAAKVSLIILLLLFNGTYYLKKNTGVNLILMSIKNPLSLHLRNHCYEEANIRWPLDLTNHYRGTYLLIWLWCYLTKQISKQIYRLDFLRPDYSYWIDWYKSKF